MKTNDSKLHQLFDKELWSDTQKHIAIVTGITTQLIDTHGNAITDYTVKNSFCELIMKDQIQGKLCKKCKSRGALEALQNKKPYIHLCPFDLIEISIPIVINQEYLGSICGGQVRLLIPEAGDHLEHLVEPKKSLKFIENPDIKKLYTNLNKMKCTDIMAVARMLTSLTNYLIKCSLEPIMNSSIINKCQNESNRNYNSADMTIVIPKNTKGENFFFSSEVPDKYVPRNHLLQPVFNYIYINKGENVSLTDAASLCNLSSSYFSRLFTKEMGINYSLFVNQLKIEWAKDLLESTNLSITQISCELGYNDSAYFIKMFKRYEKDTPAKYRKKFLV